MVRPLTKPLFFPDQCGYGGADYGRAFNIETIHGDRCFTAKAELNLGPAFLRQGDFAVEPYIYADGGIVKQFDDPLSPHPKSASLIGAGVGAEISLPNNLTGILEYSQPFRRDAPFGQSDARRLYFRLRLNSEPSRILKRPLLFRLCLQRQCVQLPAHAAFQSAIDQLVLLYARLAIKGG